MKYLFGPVPSRRLGISLGIDLVPFKTCTYDCVYCECGKTTNKTIRRKEFFPYRNLIRELNRFLKTKPKLDYITFSGSGEPTLSSIIGKVIVYLKKKYPQYKIAVLTNGALLYRKQVRIDLDQADIVIPSIDAVTSKTFKIINKPHSKLNLKNIIDGLIVFKNKFKGHLWLEIFIIKGINDSGKEILKIKKLMDKLKPEKIQLNTLDRPGTEAWVKQVSKQELLKIKKLIPDSEIIAKFKDKEKYFRDHSTSIDELIISAISRRPMTIKDLNVILNIKIAELQKYIRILLDQKRIITKKGKRGIFFEIRR